MESTDTISLADEEKAAGIISALMITLSGHATTPRSMTRADVNYLRGRLDLLEYLITPASGAQIDKPKTLAPLACSVCGPKALPFTVYHRDKVWYCAEHLPAGITWPVGMHGDDLKIYKERK